MSRNILITGCSSGFGLALTQHYLGNNYKVYGISRNKPNLKDDNFTFIEADLADTKNIKPLLSSQLQAIASFDTVFLNAGTLGKIDILENLPIEELQRVMEINVYANKELLDILAKCEGVNTIIGISSGASVNGSKGWAAYSLSKASLNMLINLYAKEMLNSKLLAVAPGVIETPMTDVIRFKTDDEKFPSAKVLKEGTIQTPQEAATRMFEFLKRTDEFESGSFLDVRKV